MHFLPFHIFRDHHKASTSPSRETDLGPTVTKLDFVPSSAFPTRPSLYVHDIALESKRSADGDGEDFVGPSRKMEVSTTVPPETTQDAPSLSTVHAWPSLQLDQFSWQNIHTLTVDTRASDTAPSTAFTLLMHCRRVHKCSLVFNTLATSDLMSGQVELPFGSGALEAPSVLPFLTEMSMDIYTPRPVPPPDRTVSTLDSSSSSSSDAVPVLDVVHQLFRLPCLTKFTLRANPTTTETGLAAKGFLPLVPLAVDRPGFLRLLAQASYALTDIEIANFHVYPEIIADMVSTLPKLAAYSVKTGSLHIADCFSGTGEQGSYFIGDVFEDVLEEGVDPPGRGHEVEFGLVQGAGRNEGAIATEPWLSAMHPDWKNDYCDDDENIEGEEIADVDWLNIERQAT